MDKYAFLMIKYKTPSIVSEIQDKLNKDELYIEDNGRFSYGIEKDCHVTIAACMDNDVDIEDLKKYLKPLSTYQAYITNISSFKNEKYDVLKCDVASLPIVETNEIITKNFTLHSEYKTYHPHLTIAYVKHGVAEKYKKDNMDKLIKLTPKEFWFSYYDKDGNEKEVTWK